MAEGQPPQGWQQADPGRPAPTPPQPAASRPAAPATPGTPQTPPSPTRPPTAAPAKAHWKPVFKVGSLLSGAITGMSALVLLQQYGKVLMTTTNLLLAAVAGILFGLFLSWAAYGLGVTKYNRAAGTAATPRPRSGPPGAFIVLLGVAALLAATGDARASLSGPCEGTLAGADLDDTKVIRVAEGDDVPYLFSASTGVVSSRIELVYGPFSQVLVDESHSGETQSIEGDAPVSDFAWMGVGLYEVNAEVGLQGGDECRAHLRVLVEGNPLTTIAGAAAAVGALGGTAGIIWSFASTIGSVKP